MRLLNTAMAVVLTGMMSTQAQAENIYGLQSGHPQILSASALAFGPDGILFVGDSQGAAIYAIQTGDQRNSKPVSESIEGINEKLAKVMDAAPDSIKITDLAVNPETKSIYLAVQGHAEAPRIFKVDNSPLGVTELELKSVEFAAAALPNAAEDKEITAGNRKRNNRTSAITDLAFDNGQLLVAGLSNDQSASNVWALVFPFKEIDHGTSLEIYHGAHGRSEDYAPIRTFVPFIVNGEPSLLAGYVCTPLVKFPLSQLKGDAKKSEKVRGTTVAELGNRNQPLDMIAYKKDNRDYLLLSNSARGVMKISTEKLSSNEGINSPIPDGKTAGQEYETVKSLDGTVQLDKYDDTHAVVLIQQDKGPVNLKIVELP